MPATLVRPLRLDLVPEVEDVHRREFIVGCVALAAVLATGGCGDGSDATTRDASSRRSVVDARGVTVELDGVPTRIFTTTYRMVLDELLLLGVTPVGFAAHPSEQLPP